MRHQQLPASAEIVSRVQETTDIFTLQLRPTIRRIRRC